MRTYCYIEVVSWLSLYCKLLPLVVMCDDRETVGALWTLLELLDDLWQLLIGYFVKFRVNRGFDSHQLLIASLGKIILGAK